MDVNVKRYYYTDNKKKFAAYFSLLAVDFGELQELEVTNPLGTAPLSEVFQTFLQHASFAIPSDAWRR